MWNTIAPPKIVGKRFVTHTVGGVAAIRHRYGKCWSQVRWQSILVLSYMRGVPHEEDSSIYPGITASSIEKAIDILLL